MLEKKDVDTFRVKPIEIEMVRLFRMLKPKDRSLAYQYLYDLAQKQLVKNDLENAPDLRMVYVIPNSRAFAQHCPFIPRTSTENLIIVISADLDAAWVYKTLGASFEFFFITKDKEKINTIHKAALDVMALMDNVEQVQEFFMREIDLLAGIQNQDMKEGNENGWD